MDRDTKDFLLMWALVIGVGFVGGATGAITVLAAFWVLVCG